MFLGNATLANLVGIMPSPLPNSEKFLLTFSEYWPIYFLRQLVGSRHQQEVGEEGRMYDSICKTFLDTSRIKGIEMIEKC